MVLLGQATWTRWTLSGAQSSLTIQESDCPLLGSIGPEKAEKVRRSMVSAVPALTNFTRVPARRQGTADKGLSPSSSRMGSIYKAPPQHRDSEWWDGSQAAESKKKNNPK